MGKPFLIIFSSFVTWIGSYSVGGNDFSAIIVLSAICPIWYSESAKVATVSLLATSKKAITRSERKVISKTRKAPLFLLTKLKGFIK